MVNLGNGIELRHPGQFFIGGEWLAPTSDRTFDVVDSATGAVFNTVAQAADADMDRAIGAARQAFDHGPWPRMAHAERAAYLQKMADGLRRRAADLAAIWTRESGILHRLALRRPDETARIFEYYAGLAQTFPFEEAVRPTAGGDFGLVVREPVGVVGAIIPWNGPLGLISHKLAPAMIAGCTTVLKPSPEAPAIGYVFAEIAESIGLPPGVLNVLTADREVSEMLVRDPRVDKIAFTGSAAAGRRIASVCGDRVARYTLELGGKSPAVILDDADIPAAARTLAQAELFLTGQACMSLTRIIVNRSLHDELLDAIAAEFSAVNVGDPFDAATDMGPLATRRQRSIVEDFIAKGRTDGAVLAAGGRRPPHLDRGWFIEPTVFGRVQNSWTIAREEIFGPVLCVIPSDSEEESIEIANDSIYGLNASVFTEDVDRARRVAAQLRTGTVGHNAVRTDFGMAFGGFKQSGIGREGGIEGLRPYLELKSVILEGRPEEYR